MMKIKDIILDTDDMILVSAVIDLSKKYPKGVKAKPVFNRLLSLAGGCVKCPTCSRSLMKEEIDPKQVSNTTKRRYITIIGQRCKALSERGSLRRVVVQELYNKPQYGYLPVENWKDLPEEIKSVYSFKRA